MSDDHDRTEINAIELLELLGEDFDELPGLERLRLAGKVAPRMRGATESLRKRRWSVENPEGAVVGETTPEEFWQSLVKAEKLSLDVGPGVRPKAVSCRYCGDLIVVGRRGPVRTVCSASCPAAPVCAGGCGKRAPTSALHRSAMARRRAKTGTDQWRCGSCRSSNNWAQRTPEARAPEGSKPATVGCDDGRRARDPPRDRPCMVGIADR